jgi:adenylate kinase
VKYKTFLLFGSPGSGKGTQGKILGTIPGFFHIACGEVFRAIDYRSELGQLYLQYSSKGDLVPDDITVRLWQQHMDNMVILSRFKPDIDHLILDGIPRSVAQAKHLESSIDVKKVFHLSCNKEAELIERMKRRALKENRLDDANEDTIRRRLLTYHEESRPVLEFYGKERIVDVDAMQWPYKVLRDILKHVDTAE